MKKMKLKENHPTAIKLSKLFGVMDRMGFCISFEDGEITLHETRGDKTYNIEDLLGEEKCNELPPPFDYKVTYVKDD